MCILIVNERVEFNTPHDTVEVISEAECTSHHNQSNHLFQATRPVEREAGRQKPIVISLWFYYYRILFIFLKVVPIFTFECSLFCDLSIKFFFVFSCVSTVCFRISVATIKVSCVCFNLYSLYVAQCGHCTMHYTKQLQILLLLLLINSTAWLHAWFMSNKLLSLTYLPNSRYDLIRMWKEPTYWSCAGAIEPHSCHWATRAAHTTVTAGQPSSAESETDSYSTPTAGELHNNSARARNRPLLTRHKLSPSFFPANCFGIEIQNTANETSLHKLCM